METNKSAYLVQPLDRALQLLHCLAEAGRELTLTEISNRAGLPKTTAYRYLMTLGKWGIVSQDTTTDLYRLGPYVHVLARCVGKAPGLREAALPALHQLRDRFNETVNLGELDGKEVVYIEIAESRRSLRMQASVGSRDPVYSTALGKALLAALPQEQWAPHLPLSLRPRTSKTRCSRDALFANLAQVRECGYALDRGENEEGAFCIAAAIYGPQGPVAAISISAPASRVQNETERAMASAVQEAAAAISERLRQIPDH